MFIKGSRHDGAPCFTPEHCADPDSVHETLLHFLARALHDFHCPLLIGCIRNMQHAHNKGPYREPRIEESHLSQVTKLLCRREHGTK